MTDKIELEEDFIATQREISKRSFWTSLMKLIPATAVSFTVIGVPIFLNEAGLMPIAAALPIATVGIVGFLSSLVVIIGLSDQTEEHQALQERLFEAYGLSGKLLEGRVSYRENASNWILFEEESGVTPYLFKVERGELKVYDSKRKPVPRKRVKELKAKETESYDIWQVVGATEAAGS